MNTKFDFFASESLVYRVITTDLPDVQQRKAVGRLRWLKIE